MRKSPHILLIAAFLHISWKCAYCMFSRITWHSRRQFQYYLHFYYLFLLGFVTSTILLPTEWHQPCVRITVEWDGVVGFKQFCTTFQHISAAYLVFMQSAYFFKCRIKLTRLETPSVSDWLTARWPCSTWWCNRTARTPRCSWRARCRGRSRRTSTWTGTAGDSTLSCIHSTTAVADGPARRPACRASCYIQMWTLTATRITR